MCLSQSKRDETVYSLFTWFRATETPPPLVDRRRRAGQESQPTKVKIFEEPFRIRMSEKRALSRAMAFAFFVATVVASPVAPSFRVPRYSLPHQVEAGSRSFHSIQSAAKGESIFDRFWGTDCFSKALQEFSSECRGAHEPRRRPQSPTLGRSLVLGARPSANRFAARAKGTSCLSAD